MGSRGRSIRLRIYFLVAIPLITMLGLFGYVAYTSTTTYLNLDRAPDLIDATAEPLTNFVGVLQQERRAAVVYLSRPSDASLDAYRTAITTTSQGELEVTAALNSTGTTGSSTPAETAGIAAMTAGLNSLTSLRNEVIAKEMPSLDALAAYTKVVTGQGAVLEAEANSISDTAGVEQGLGLIAAVDGREDLSQQDALLASALVSGSLTGQERVAFGQAAGRQQDDMLLYQQLFTPAELSTYNAAVNSLAPAALQSNLTSIQQAVMAGTPLSEIERLGLTPDAWQTLTSTWLHAGSVAGENTAAIVLSANSSPARVARQRLWAVGAVGAAGLILTLLVTILLGRSINGRLTALRRSALTLAQEQLPAVVARLRRGESVDVAAEAPPIRVGSDEIGQVGEAIDAVRQTAIRSAIDEAQVRQGVNDMFRNLARRNQSLLQRQLSVLDDMERRATDPDVLEDLFKMDHLTTRMRRHAEGLIILSGAPPGRSWSAPVKLIDVMRGAVAEVEDYARVMVSTQAQAALSGSAVTDVIHLLAELIENATSLSPPFTQVRVGGESVANGFAIEIEDRGLGMPPQRIAELNDRLANPPDLNPANTEQLGLFVVGQLARRHGISVTLRPSPYGGTTAIVLVPTDLIVEGPAALAAGRGGAPAAWAGPGAGPGAGMGPVAGAGAIAAGQNGNSRPSASGAVSLPATPAAGNDWQLGSSPAAAGRLASDAAPASGAMPVSGAAQVRGAAPAESIRIAGPVRQGAGAAAGFAPNSAAPNGAETGVRRGGRHGSDDVPVVTGVPVGRPGPPPGVPFDVFTPIHRPEPDEIEYAPDAEYPQVYPDFGRNDFGNSDHTSNEQGNIDHGNSDFGNNGAADGGYHKGEPDSGVDFTGLPRRVRQASIAPELRAAAAANSTGPAGVPTATAASLTDMRNTLSAMQRGWQQGRSQPQRDTEGNVVDGD
jgi:signal transduction histidine kinase